MRETKFRGKRENGGEWIYGSLLVMKGRTFINIPSLADKESYRNSSYSDYLVKPESVGQFIGLKDKTRKDIYDGDIVMCKLNEEDTYFYARLSIDNRYGLIFNTHRICENDFVKEELLKISGIDLLSCFYMTDDIDFGITNIAKEEVCERITVTGNKYDHLEMNV